MTVNFHQLEDIQDRYCEHPTFVDTEFLNLATAIMRKYSMDLPKNYTDGLQLYFILLQELDTLID